MDTSISLCVSNELLLLYLVFSNLGVPAIKPDFMRTKKQRKIKIPPKKKGDAKTKRKSIGTNKNKRDNSSESDSEDSDEEWHPDMHRKKIIRGQLSPWFIQTCKSLEVN